MGLRNFYNRIFHRAHFRKVDSTYRSFKTDFHQGFLYYLSKKGLRDRSNDFTLKEQLLKDKETVLYYDNVFKEYQKIKKRYGVGFIHYLKTNGEQETDLFEFKEAVVKNKRIITDYDRTLKSYNKLVRDYPQAILLYLSRVSLDNVEYETIKETVRNKDVIIEINDKLFEFERLRRTYPVSVQTIIGDHTLNVDLLNDVISRKDLLQTSEIFYEKSKDCSFDRLILFNLKPEDRYIVSADTHNAKKAFMDYLKITVPDLSAPVFEMIPTTKKLADYLFTTYEDNPISTEGISMADIIDLADEVAKYGYSLNGAISLIDRNSRSILQYCRENYIEPVLNISTIKQIFKTKVQDVVIKREDDYRKAKDIIEHNPRGFDKMVSLGKLKPFGVEAKPADCYKIISLEEEIKRWDDKLYEQEREQRRLEEERRQKEEERRRQELAKRKEREEYLRRQKMLAHVSEWHLNRYGIRTFSMLYYIPVSSGINATEDEWDNRNIIWAFKNNPDRSSTRISYTEALEKVIDYATTVLTKDFGEDLEKLTLVCITASTKEKTERRFKQFAEKLCSKTKMLNSYSRINIIKDSVASTLGGDGTPELQFDKYFFNGKYILLFDDVTTTGSSIMRYKNVLESMGAFVVGALTIGKTKHDHMGLDPIYRYL